MQEARAEAARLLEQLAAAAEAARAQEETIAQLRRELERLGDSGFIVGKTAIQPGVRALQIEGFSASNKSINAMQMGVWRHSSSPPGPTATLAAASGTRRWRRA